MLERRRIVVRGVVQGIGFRPFVYRLADDASLTGWVRNDGRGVHIELQGKASMLDGALTRLRADLPPGGRLDDVQIDPLPLVDDEAEFVIAVSEPTETLRVSIAPDRFVCADCLKELRDRSDRRHAYPFINCTACGPRYTIARQLPYDRPNTTMAAFELCPDCRVEYEEPRNRRYHAEPVACPICGPHTWLANPDGATDLEAVRPDDPTRLEPLSAVIALLRAGKVVAIKGIGGFHLACDARSDEAVSRLRRQKRRPRKPFAVMVQSLEIARRCIVLDEADEQLLTSPAAPILLAPRRGDGALADGIAPGLTDLGVMLPYSPLHHLLFDGPLDALVMTSGNHPSEPITTDNREALEMLPADGYLMHDRDIEVANDDSVIRTTTRGPLMVRRSRGYVPDGLDGSHLPERSVLALGAELKVTVTTLHLGDLVVGRHLGDLDNPRAEEAFRLEVDRMLRFGRIDPEAVALDLHPDVASAAYAESRFSGRPLLRIQHHHAHLAAVLAEHRVAPDRRAIGIVLDGFGYGEDGAIWGGEILRGDYSEVERLTHLRYVPQPGGDRAAREPYRMATAHLVDAGLDAAASPAFDEQIAAICGVRSVAPLTSSAGRLFDAAAALLGVAPRVQDYEAQAASELEAIADPQCDDAYPLPCADGVLDTRALLSALLDDRASVPVRAARFHNGLADGLVAAALASGDEPVALGGGCVANRLLFHRLVHRLQAARRTVWWPQRLPAGDGGLSVGQAACAACMLQV